MKFAFQIKINQGITVEEYAEAWKQASAVIQKTPGTRGTYLHREKTIGAIARISTCDLGSALRCQGLTV